MHHTALAVAIACAAAALTSASPARADAVVAGRSASFLAGLPADSAPEGTTARHRTFGVTVDVGVPDGAALGLVVRPRFDWLRLEVAAAHNAMAPGVRFGATIDPFASIVAPTATVQGGHFWPGALIFVQNSPSVEYNYVNLHVGLEIGRRAAFRFYVRGGVSWLDVTAANVDTAKSGPGITNPAYSGWLAPSGKLGFSAFF